MASDFWRTSHWRFLTTREELNETHAKDRRLGLSEDAIQDLKVYCIEYLSDLAKVSQQLIRRRVVSTAATYFRRFYIRRNFCENDPQHVAPACLYVACKSEEAQVQAKVLFQVMRKLSARRPAWPVLDMARLLDLEMAVLEELDYSLVILNPYRDLMAFLQDTRIRSLAEFAWAALNDTYRTDMCLLFPPFMIALAAVNLAAAIAKHDIQEWLAELDISLSMLAAATKDLASCYRRFDGTISAAEAGRLIAIVTTQHVT